MNYWIPTIILGFVLLVLIAQLPWQRPGAGQQEEARLDLGLRDWEQDSAAAPEEDQDREPVHS